MKVLWGPWRREPQAGGKGAFEKGVAKEKSMEGEGAARWRLVEARGEMLNRTNSQASTGLRLRGEMAYGIEARYPQGSVGIDDGLAGSSAHLTRGDLSGSAAHLGASGSC